MLRYLEGLFFMFKESRPGLFEDWCSLTKGFTSVTIPWNSNDVHLHVQKPQVKLGVGG